MSSGTRASVGTTAVGGLLLVFWLGLGMGPLATGLGIGTVEHRVVDVLSIALALLLAAALAWLMSRFSRCTSTLPLRRAVDGIPVAVALCAVASAYLRVAQISDFGDYLRLAHHVVGGGANTVYPRLVPALAILLGCILVIAPWSIRNGYKYRALVPISTNGGPVFYSANSSPDWRLQGRYVPAHYQQLQQWYPNEVIRNKQGFVLGVRNLITYPAAALISIPWRVGQLLARAGVWPAVYIAANQARHSYDAVFNIVLVSILLGLWGLWYRGWQLWRTVQNQLYDGDAIPWHHVAFAVVFIASLFFECAGRYVLSMLPFVIAVWMRAEIGPGPRGREGATATRDLSDAALLPLLIRSRENPLMLLFGDTARPHLNPG